jgi:multidrug transporter EmrE-like cation transporter
MEKLILIASCVVAVAADMLLVWWAKQADHPAWILILGMILLNVAAVVWAYSMYKGIESATAITFYALFTVAGCSLLGFLVFKEALTAVNAVGIGLSLIALVLIGI